MEIQNDGMLALGAGEVGSMLVWGVMGGRRLGEVASGQPFSSAFRGSEDPDPKEPCSVHASPHLNPDHPVM